MDMAAWVDKFGFPICAAIWMTWYGWFMTKRYMSAVETAAKEAKDTAVQLVIQNASLTAMQNESTVALTKNTKATDNLSTKFDGLSTQIGKLTACEASLLASKIREKP